MKVKRTIPYTLGALAIGILVFVGTISAFGPGFANEENRAARKQAIEEDDFEAWRNAVIESLTQENFDKIVERHNAMTERRELHTAMRDAIANGDYEAFKEAFENLFEFREIMSEEHFNVMVERYDSEKPFGHRMWFGRHHIHRQMEGGN